MRLAARTLLALAPVVAIDVVAVDPARAQSVPTNFVVDTLLSSGLTAPTDFCFLPDGRMLIANRPGAVSLWINGSNTSSIIGTVPNVEVGQERALLSVAADPLFPINGFIYVWYASTADNFMHLDRFTCTGDLANSISTNLTINVASRRVIIASVPDVNFNHNGGSTRFGPDGKLYQSFGDDAQTCTSQVLTSQLGALLRMDVSQLGPAAGTTPPTFAQLNPGDNPLSANTDFSQLVLCYGLRNPVRYTIDPTTGNLYIGDVGQNAHEEYDEYIYQPGALQLVNFGWPWREGNFAYTGASCGGTQPSGMVGPIVDVPQAGTGWLSSMGGPRYHNRGGQFDFGAAYEGIAFYGDYFAGQIRVLQNTGGTWAPAPAFPGQPSATNWAQNIIGLVSYDVGPDGAIYAVQQAGTYSTSGGFLKRIRPLGPVNGIVLVSGGGQAGPAGEPFPQPVVVQVNDPLGGPLPGGTVNFTVSGPATLSTTNPVIADGSGRAQTSVTGLTIAGGPITVTASTPGNPTPVSASLFARKITLTRASGLLVLQVTNTSPVSPVSVPFVIMCSAPGIAPLPTPIGPICTDPYNPFTFVIEDSIGLFNFVTLSGSGAVGNPGISKIYNLPVGALAGVTLWFQGVGLDPVAGPVRTNCEIKTL